MSAKWKKTKFKKGTIYSETDRNSWLAQVCVEGKVYRKRCKTKPEAQTFIEMAMQIGELQSPPLSPNDMRDAILARDYLGKGNVLPWIKNAAREAERLPDGVSIRDAVTFYLNNNTITEQITVSEAVSRFIDRKQKSNLREKTLKDYTSRTSVLVDEIGEMMVDSVTTSNLIEILDEYLWKPRNQNNYRDTWVTFFEYCRKLDYCRENPATKIDPIPVDEVIVKPYTVEECQAYLHATEEIAPAYVPFLALGFFAGIRTTELERMAWDQVGAEVIDIMPEGSKVRTHREVIIPDNLHRWLDKHRDKGPILKAGFKNFHDHHKPQILEVAKIQPPPRNVARKSYASYHYALTGSASRTAANMGTSEAKVFSNYRGKVSQKDAERYFQIVPA